MKAIALIVVLGLAACAHTPESIIKTEPVKVAVPEKCSPTLSPEPTYPSAQAIANAPNIFEQVKLLVQDRILRIAREAELNAALKGCEGNR